jgi:hypothetical protein
MGYPMKKRPIYLTVAVLTFLLGILFTSRSLIDSKPETAINRNTPLATSTVEIESRAAEELLRQGGNFRYLKTIDGRTKEGGSNWSQEFESSDGLWAHETFGDYKSNERARQVFEEEIRGAIISYEKGKSLTRNRMVGVFKKPGSGEQFVSVVKLNEATVYRIDAPTLRHALAFEKRPR